MHGYCQHVFKCLSCALDCFFKLQVLVLCLFYAVVYYGLYCRAVSPRVVLFLVLKNVVRSRGIVSGGVGGGAVGASQAAQCWGRQNGGD